ncbi:glycosyltransferase family 2 protein [Pseudomonadota bacterium]
MVNTQPLVSVLITVYNRERFLTTAIESVLAQSYQNFELIIVDDCSTDKSVEIARQYLSDPRVQLYVNEQNLGDYPNRKKAASYAQGKYLKYVDADDFILPYCLEVMVHAMECFPDAGAGLSVNGWQWEMLPQQLMPQEVYRAHFFHNQNIFGAAPLSSIIKRKVFENLGGFNEGWNTGDSDFWLRAFSIWPAVCLPPGLAHWRTHEGQESSIQTRDLMKQVDVSSRMRKLTISALEKESCPLSKREKSYLVHILKRKALRAGASQLLHNGVKAALMTWRAISLKDIPFLVLRRRKLFVGPLNIVEEKRRLPNKRTIQKDGDVPPLVTVILSADKSVTDLEKSLHSVLNQTTENWELLVMDSPGRSQVTRLMEQYASDYRVRHVRTNDIENTWDAYNLGASLSQSKYLKFLGPGDCLYEHCLKCMLSLMEHHGEAALGISGPCGPYRPGVQLHPDAALNSELFGTPRFLESPSAIIVDRAKYLEVGGFNSEFSPSERHLQLRLSSLAPSVLMQRGLVHYGPRTTKTFNGQENWPLGWAQGYEWIIQWLNSNRRELGEEQARLATENLLRVAWKNRNRVKNPANEKRKILSLAKLYGITRTALNESPPFLRKGWTEAMDAKVRNIMLTTPDWTAFGFADNESPMFSRG